MKFLAAQPVMQAVPILATNQATCPASPNQVRWPTRAVVSSARPGPTSWQRLEKAPTLRQWFPCPYYCSLGHTAPGRAWTGGSNLAVATAVCGVLGTRIRAKCSQTGGRRQGRPSLEVCQAALKTNGGSNLSSSRSSCRSSDSGVTPFSSACAASEELLRYANGILCSGDLEAKLTPPPVGLEKQLLGEQHAYEKLRAIQAASTLSSGKAAEGFDVDWPAREAKIEMCSEVLRGSSQLPKASQILASVGARIRCLQKFAHHELQAVELFAWALLRFPLAPRGLQVGVLRTLTEEQDHCRLYLSRIAALTPEGVSAAPFGKPPLSSHLWRGLGAIRTAADPMSAFLCGIGLTYEAANLDHTLKFRDLFRQAGDKASAEALQRIHDDEVGHVRLARVWLRRIARRPHGPERALSADCHIDDVDLYSTHAAFPPFELQKARGRPMLAFEGRRRAGFSERYIREVSSAKRRPIPCQQQ